MYHYSKRLLDVTLSGAALLALSPILGVSAVAIRLFMGKPVLFQQDRPGKDGKIFRLHKFRTMLLSSTEDTSFQAENARLTKLGRLLRSTSLDELPTLVNVLKGEMSLVGPRPLLVRYLGRYSPEQARRHEVMPGITGWAQINGRNALSWEEKFDHDVWYVDNRSFFLDMRILAVTVLKVFKRDGISHSGFSTMPEFGLEPHDQE